MKTIKGVVFDLYGTLYDVHSVSGLCSEYFPGRGLEISMIWRQKQLEYTWLRSLMDSYVSFEDATRRALCNEYLNLKPYPEVPAMLEKLQSSGLPLAILSNGSIRSIAEVVSNSGLEHRFDHQISVESVRTFKPHTLVYELAENILKLHRSEIMFVSSNAWDAAGARHFGYPVSWINRSGNTFDELGETPNYIIDSLADLPTIVTQISEG